MKEITIILRPAHNVPHERDMKGESLVVLQIIPASVIS